MMRHSRALIVLVALALASAGWVRAQDQKTAEAADPTAAARNRMVHWGESVEPREVLCQILPIRVL